MLDKCLNKLQSEWDYSLLHRVGKRGKVSDEPDYANLGIILRSLVNFLKSTDAGIKEFETDLAAKMQYLENALPEMEFKVSIAVIGSLRHARKSVRTNSSNFGTAFTNGLDAATRRRIRKRNRAPQLVLQTGEYREESHPALADNSGLFVERLGDEND